MKAAPVMRALAEYPHIQQFLVHTGQHYDANMSDIFFAQLGMSAPDVNLGVGSGTHAQQTAEILRRLESVLLERKPQLVLVYGDVNSTVAAALACSKLLIPIGHVEAGLRSSDRTMPEEINRVVTDTLSELLFTPSEDGDINLFREGIAQDKVHRVGNVMIDSLVRMLASATQISLKTYPERFALVTFHRPSNVDDSAVLKTILEVLLELRNRVEVIFPLHPRTKKRILDLGLKLERLFLTEPLSYVEFLALQRQALVVITDSGGIQEETTYLGIPCLTLRDNTERPITVTMGTNILVGRHGEGLMNEVDNILSGKRKHGRIPPFWDGVASQRIAKIISALS